MITGYSMCSMVRLPLGRRVKAQSAAILPPGADEYRGQLRNV